MSRQANIVILLFDGFTALDAVGPYEVLSRIPGAQVTFVAESAGPVVTDSGVLTVQASTAISDAPAPDVLLVPGGPGEVAVRSNETVLAWIREAHEVSTWTASVCTGSLLLGAAGLLAGKPATTHWLAMDVLAGFGARPTAERVVEAGKIVTGAGVSAGIDLALRLTDRIAGTRVAETIQLMIEYAPDPPFTAGSPTTAPEGIVTFLRSRSRLATESQ